MAWSSGSINLKAAQTIFLDVCIKEIKIAEKTVGYTATINGVACTQTSLTQLCQDLWKSTRR